MMMPIKPLSGKTHTLFLMQKSAIKPLDGISMCTEKTWRMKSILLILYPTQHWCWQVSASRWPLVPVCATGFNPFFTAGCMNEQWGPTLLIFKIVSIQGLGRNYTGFGTLNHSNNHIYLTLRTITIQDLPSPPKSSYKLINLSSYSPI